MTKISNEKTHLRVRFFYALLKKMHDYGGAISLQKSKIRKF